MSNMYLFKAFFMNESALEHEVHYQLSEEDPDRCEALIYCWKEALKFYCPNDDKAEKRLLRQIHKNFTTYHDLQGFNLRYKDNDGKTNYLGCTTNYAEIGIDIT